MTNNRQFFKSRIVRKLLQTYLLIAFAFIMIFYGVIYWQHVQSQKQTARFAFEQSYSQIATYLEKAPITDNATLSKVVTLENTNYQIMLFSSNGNTLAINKFVSEQPEDSTLAIPRWNSHKKNQILYENGQLESWRTLPQNNRMYARISLPQQHFWQHKRQPILWFLVLLSPFFIMLLLGTSLLALLRKNYFAWQSMLDYTADIEQSTQYQPLKTKAENELSSLQHLLNRLSFRLHKQRSTIQNYKKHTHQVLEKSPDSIFLTDTEQQLTYANKQFLNIFRLQKEQLTGLKLSDLVLAASASVQSTLDNLHLEPKQIKMLVKANQSKDKYDLLLNPLYDDNNSLTGFSGTLHEVNRDQNELAKLQLSQLEIDDRLSANEKLWAVMGHELRTPLNGMLGMIQLLAETNLDDEQQDFVATLKSSSNSMLFLLNDMLDLSKLDAGKMESVASNIDILALCREVCDLMIGNARKKEIELVFFAALDMPRFAVTDPFRLRQVFLNLLGNAFKFTQRGHVALMVKKVTADAEIFQNRYIKVAEDQQWLCFRIIDTGPGIPEEEQQQLFYFFNQANNTISRRFGGTGLGLAISKGLVEMLGGFIQLESDVGRGTNFDVYVPVNIEDTQPIYTYPDALSEQQIFIFDPNPLNRAYLNNLLNALNAPHKIFGSLDKGFFDQLAKDKGKEGSKEGANPVLIIDYEMFPEHQITNDIFNHPEFNSTKKLLMSFRSQRSIPSRVIACFDGFIEKPLMIENFLAEILRVSKVNNADKRFGKQSFQDMLAQVNTAREAEAQKAKAAEKANYNITVLLAEDNIVNQKVATKMLEKHGCRVIVAENGEIAIEKLNNSEEKIHLILMDCRMPKMDGLTATKEIRAQKHGLPIIALTANDTDEDRYACEEAGMDDFLAKPINQEKLVEIMSHYSPLFNNSQKLRALNADLI